jgi:hypothetical protein
VSNKQIKITAELLGRCTHTLDELNIPYVVVLENVDLLFTNTSHRHAVSIIRDALCLHEKVFDEKTTVKAEKLADTYGKDEL